MKHRHLLPNEIDLLVDGETGFGIAPLAAHLAECGGCAARVAEARVVVDALERLPHFAPQPGLADRVMARVPVFVPAHVAAGDAVARWLPQSPRARIAAAAVFATMSGAVTLALLWLASRGDAVLFIGGLLGERLRATVTSAVGDIVLAVLGESAVTALQATGIVGTSLLALGFLLTAAATVVGIRRLALAGRRA